MDQFSYPFRIQALVSQLCKHLQRLLERLIGYKEQKLVLLECQNHLLKTFPKVIYSGNFRTFNILDYF